MAKDYWIQTVSGKRFSFSTLNIEDIPIEDIACSLSKLCRFTGQIPVFYSVADHCISVSKLLSYDRDLSLYGLIHDCGEALTGDINSPLKNSIAMEEFRKLEDILQGKIYIKYGLEPVEPAEVKHADLVMLATEYRDLMTIKRDDWHTPYPPREERVIPLSIKDAERLFLERFYELLNAK